MATLQINLDGDALRDATVQAISGYLTPEAKSAMIEKAILILLHPSTNAWEKNKSPIEIAFEKAVQDVALAEAQAMMAENDELRKRINALMVKSIERMLSVDADELARRMGNAFVDSLRR